MKTVYVRTLSTAFDKMIGLLGSKKLYPVYFKTRFGIHTYGMRSPIDVVILDSEYIIVKYVEALLPNNFFFWSPRFNHVIELPPGEIKKQALYIGTKIMLKNL